MKITKCANFDEASRKAANLISAQILMKPDCVLGLATGSSPIGIYNYLIDMYKKGDLDFSRVHSINLDEYVGLDAKHPQGYRYFMEENLFKSVNIDRKNTYVPCGIAKDLAKECKDYDQLVEDMGGIDVQLLGIGFDGHIGFNEPADKFEKGTHVVDLLPSTIKANARFFASEKEVPKQALTMGMGGIMQAKKIVLIASEEKHEIVEKALFGDITSLLPASLLQLHPDVNVFYV